MMCYYINVHFKGQRVNTLPHTAQQSAAVNDGKVWWRTASGLERNFSGKDSPDLEERGILYVPVPINVSYVICSSNGHKTLITSILYSNSHIRQTPTSRVPIIIITVSKGAYSCHLSKIHT